MRPEQAAPRPSANYLVETEIASAPRSEKGGRPTEALAHYRNALTQAGTDPMLFSATVVQVARAVQRAPKDAALRHLLGTALLFERDTRGAEGHLRRAATLAPRSTPILCTLGDCLMQGGKPEEALAAYRKAVSLAPEDKDARLRLAGLLAYSGERAEARDLYLRLINEGARDPLAYSGLIEVSDYSGAETEPPEYSTAVSLAESPKYPPAMRRMLHFSAARIDRQRKRRDQEFEHYRRAKEHFPHPFDLKYFSELVAMLKEAITPAFYAERSAFSDKSKRPIFIFGMPRSGTTLTEQILASHPSVAAAGELTFFTEAARDLGLAPRKTGKSLPLERISARLNSLDMTYTKRLATKYSEQLQWRGGGKIRVTDKMPGNFLHLWLIALVFREAGYIHCTRDPLATCFSCYTTDLGDAHAYTADFSTLAGYYRLYADLMAHWSKVLPVAMFESRYEDLVLDPESAVRRLLDAVGLPWDPNCLSFHESHRLARTASYAALREPNHPRNHDKWRAYEPYLAPLKTALAEGGLMARPAES
jgi:tetratricopeptide (TPR) repeat protein